MKEVYLKSQAKKETLCKERLRNHKDMCYLHAAQDAAVETKRAPQFHAANNKMLWAPVICDTAGPRFASNCAHCNETRPHSPAGDQVNYYPRPSRQRRQRSSPQPTAQNDQPRGCPKELNNRRPHRAQRHSLSPVDAARQREQQLGHERQERIKWRELPRECNCRRQHGNVAKEQHLVPRLYAKDYQNLTAEGLKAKPTNGCKYHPSHKQTGNQRPSAKECKRRVELRPPKVDGQVQTEINREQYHFIKDVAAGGDGHNQKHHKHSLYERKECVAPVPQCCHRQSKQLNYTKEPPKLDTKPTRCHKQPKHEADKSRAHTKYLPQLAANKHGQAASNDGFQVLYKNPNFRKASAERGAKQAERLPRYEKPCKVGLKLCASPFGYMPMNENLAKMYNLCDADSFGTIPLHKSRAAVWQGVLQSTDRLKPGSQPKSKARHSVANKSYATTKRLQKRINDFALESSNMNDLNYSPQDIIDAKVAAPMIRRVQRIYRANLVEQTMLVKELASIPKLVKEMLKEARE